MVEKIKVSYDLNKKLKDKLAILAINKGVNQTFLIEEYIKDGLEKDKEYLITHLDHETVENVSVEKKNAK